MSEREAMARKRLERSVASVVAQLRRVADEIERDARYQTVDAAERAYEYSTYSRVAATVVNALTWGVANTNLSNLIDTAADADAARQDKGTA